MTLKKKIAISILIVCNISVAAPSIISEKNSQKNNHMQNYSKKRDRYIYQGVIGALDAYMTYDGGMVGMQSAVKKCYEKIGDEANIEGIKKCFAMDLTSHYFDVEFSSYMSSHFGSNFPRNQFFLLKNVNIRLLNSFQKHSIEIDRYKDNIINWVIETQKEYEKNIVHYLKKKED